MSAKPRRTLANRLARYVLTHAWTARCLHFLLTALVRSPASLGLRGFALRLEIALTKRLKLFDRPFYLSQFGAGKPPLGPPLRHYVLQGDAAGRRPAPLFDPQHYRKQCSCVPGRDVNALLHYALFGRFRGISPSPWLDLDYYLSTNTDVARAGIDPLQHFVRFGWREGRNPMPGLDMRVLLRKRPELRVSKSNPLVQMLQELGSLDNSLRKPGMRPNAPPADDLILLDMQRWLGPGLRPRQGADAPALDVIVPVYSGTGDTLRCIHSVLSAPVNTAFELVVIDDASPDHELSAVLARLAGAGLFTLRRNADNRGFVRTVNQGLRLHPARDVVILNADTEVHNDWLDRLLAVAATDPAIGSVTPLSNNATICSYPEPQNDNWMALEVGDAELDRLAALANGSHWVAAPTGVGFCMWMRRSCLDEVGLFDDKQFGRGYGEENDWCQRAMVRGWVNALAGGVFVRHRGAVSFRSESAERSALAQRTLRRLHPSYAQQVQRHIVADPLWSCRARLDIARLARHRRERNTLLVSHDRGGGTERHLMEQAAALQARGEGVFELRPSKRPGALALNSPLLFGLNAASTLPIGKREFFVEALGTLGITSIQLHHTIDFAVGLPDLLMAIRDQLGIPVEVTVHDYHAICPRTNLAGPDGLYCGEPAEAGCNSCLARDGLRASSGDIASWRRRHLGVLRRADRVVVPHDDVLERLQRYAPALAVEVCAHDEAAAAGAPLRVPPRDIARVLVIGAISRIKGFEVLRRAAEAAHRFRLPIEFSLLGFSLDDNLLAEAGVQVLGRYDDAEVDAHIASCDPDLVFLPSTWPETYCYALSAALRSRRPVVVFDLGAQARRVRAGAPPGSCVLALALASEPERLVRELQSLIAAARCLQPTPHLRAA